MKLLLFLPAVRSGGAERVMVSLAKGWADRGHSVTLATVNPGIDFYEVDRRVARARLDIPRDGRPVVGSVVSFIRKQRAIRRTIRSVGPDLVVSFLNRLNVRVLLAASGTGAPVVVSERIAPEKTGAGLIWKILRRLTYPGAALIVAQTEREADWFRPFAKRLATIPNPIAESVFAQARTGRPNRGPFSVIAMGRLSKQKGFDLLLDAFAAVRKSFPACRLTIYGEGEKRGELEEKVESLKLGASVSLPGVTAHPESAVACADLFVLPSRYEGFPNVLVEAMAIGLPVVAFDCPNGPREIIEHGRTGFLVPEGDAAALAAALARLLSDPSEMERLGSAAREAVRGRYSLRMVLDRWEAAFEAASAAGSGGASGDPASAAAVSEVAVPAGAAAAGAAAAGAAG